MTQDTKHTKAMESRLGDTEAKVEQMKEEVHSRAKVRENI